MVIELNGRNSIGYILVWCQVDGSDAVQYHLYIIMAAHLETTAHFDRDSSSKEEMVDYDRPVNQEYEVNLRVFPGGDDLLRHSLSISFEHIFLFTFLISL